MKCNECYWSFDNQCVSEKEETHSSSTQYTDDCVGYLDQEFENRLWDIFDECMKLLGKRNMNELLEVKKFIVAQREDDK